jgi:ribulose-phosphate 3-epimerase
MVTDPVGQTEQFAEAGGTSVIAHIEAAEDPTPVIDRARALGIGVGISLNPPTRLDAVIPYLERVDVLNVMTVNPGWAGQRFIREMLPKIEAARAEVDRRGLDLDIAVDGGIDVETGRSALDAGATVLGAASAIFSRPDPAEAARALKELLAEREARA